MRSARLSSRLGAALGLAFAICFGTGLLSHLVQHPPDWFWWPPRPVRLYQFTQGLHVTTGVASIPLLGAKLWSVYPRLFRWPPVRDVRHAAERIGVAALVAAALFEIVTGVLNTASWYAPMPFFFPSAHYWTAWLLVGAALVHLGVQLPLLRAPDPPPAAPREPGALTRRGVFGAVAAASGLLTLTTAGQTVAPLEALAVLAPRRPRAGPQGVAVNTTAAAAGVRAAALDPAYRLTLAGPVGEMSLSLTQLAGLTQHTAVLPIACVEGWSATGTWSGVRLHDLARLVGADPERAEAHVESMQTAGRYRATTVEPRHVRDPLTLLALRLAGEPLHLDHGYPARLITPSRPGVLQTKWVSKIIIQELP